MHSEDSEGGPSTSSILQTDDRQQKTPIGNLMVVGSLPGTISSMLLRTLRQRNNAWV